MKKKTWGKKTQQSAVDLNLCTEDKPASPADAPAEITAALTVLMYINPPLQQSFIFKLFFFFFFLL